MLYASLVDFCKYHGFDKTYWLAYSGGLDSQVLLDLLHKLGTQFPLELRVLHVHHGLSANANAWAEHCARSAKHYQVEYAQHHIQIEPAPGESLEELAREKRYAIFRDYIHENDILLTAHHQDDQAETFLLQLLRGAGLKGLAAMPASKAFASGLHARPLLQVRRATLLEYAKQQQLQWVEDESNENVTFSRNFLRHHVMPVIKNRWPQAAVTIARSAQHCAEAQALLNEFAADLLLEVQGSRAQTLSVAKLLTFENAKQKLILRTWIHKHAFPMPDSKKITTILQDVLLAAHDSMPCVKWESVELRRYRDDLHLLSEMNKVEDLSSQFIWDFAQPLSLSPAYSLHALRVQGGGLSSQIEKVHVRFRREGETVHLHKRGRITLKNLFQEWRVPTWERAQLPLIFLADTLIAVPGYFLDEACTAKPEEWGYQLNLQ